MFARGSLLLGLLVALMMSFASLTGPVVNASGVPNACCFKNAYCCAKRSECCPKRAAAMESVGGVPAHAGMNN